MLCKHAAEIAASVWNMSTWMLVSCVSWNKEKKNEGGKQGKEEKLCNTNILTLFHGEQRQNWAVKLLYHVRNQKFLQDFCKKLYILINLPFQFWSLNREKFSVQVKKYWFLSSFHLNLIQRIFCEIWLIDFECETLWNIKIEINWSIITHCYR